MSCIPQTLQAAGYKAVSQQQFTHPAGSPDNSAQSGQIWPKWGKVWDLFRSDFKELKYDLKKSQICPTWGLSYPYLLGHNYLTTEPPGQIVVEVQTLTDLPIHITMSIKKVPW